MLLSIVTFGIYAIWIPPKLDKWRVENTVLYINQKNGELNAVHITNMPENIVNVFSGTTGGWFVNTLVASFIISFSFGIATPFAYCRMVKWTQDNTIYRGHKVIFKGKPGELMGKWIVWLLLTIITLGIYAIWITVKLEQWRVSNTDIVPIRFKKHVQALNQNGISESDKEGISDLNQEGSIFHGTTGEWFVNTLLASLIVSFSFGIATPYAYCRMIKWTIENTSYNGSKLSFKGKGGDIMGKWLLWMLLSIVTCGIYSIWIPVKLDQWRVHNTTLYIKQQPASNIATETPTNATETKPVVKEK